MIVWDAWDGTTRKREPGRGGIMGYTILGLKEKILEMYPELERNQAAVNLVFDAEKGAYVVKMHRGSHELTTHLETKDADECMNGVKCVSLGIQVEQFVKNFAVREKL
jgi:alanyl-tRNA synthetase